MLMSQVQVVAMMPESVKENRSEGRSSGFTLTLTLLTLRDWGLEL